MPKIKIAICDENISYSERAVAYLVNHKRNEAEVYAYSGAELFLEKLKEITFQVILLGEEFVQLLPRLKDENTPIIVLMNEQVAGEEETASKRIFLPRYQPMENLWRRINVLTAAEHSCGSSGLLLSKLEVVGVYAPGGHEMQLFFSLLYAGLLAKEGRVLYLNFMPYMDFGELFGREDACNMNDLILALRGHELTAEKLQEYICEIDGISYIAPFCNPENVQEVTLRDYKEILQAVAAYTDYEYLVVDFGMGMNQLAEMLDCCQRIFCLVKEGFLYQSQLNQFLAYVNNEKPELPMRLQVINLPFQAKWIRGGGNLVEQLKWSEFGDFVRHNFAGGNE